MSRRALPYRIPPAEVIDAGPWLLVTEDGEPALPEALPDWDYQMDLRLRRTVGIDLDVARTATDLPPDAVLTLAAVWTATGSSLRGPAQRHTLVGGGRREVEIAVRLRGAELGGLLRLDTALVLSGRLAGMAPSVPHRAGSVLWSDRRSLRLQGDAPQFPLAIVDFAGTAFPERAGWHLQLGNDLDAAAMGSIILLVNERNAVTTTAFRNAARPRSIDKVVLSAVYGDIARTMIEHALGLDEFTDAASFEEDTLGATLTSVFRQCFGEASITDVRLRLARSPSLFASEVQDAVKIFERV